MIEVCSRVGVEVTKLCNWKCQTCFYRYRDDFNSHYNTPFEDIKKELDAAVSKGCNHAVIVGWGEPTLYPNVLDFVRYCKEIGITSSIITNGSTKLDIFKNLYAEGLDHLHISAHGFGNTLDTHAGVPAQAQQLRLLEYLRDNNLPWRSNTTLQKVNYQELPQIAEHCVSHGVKHFVSLGFLPHYEWKDRLREVAVHPKILRPYIEEAADIVIAGGSLLTIRYQPLCHLSQKYWKYVTNANKVVFDPWEWCYNDVYPNDGFEAMKANAESVGSAVSIKGEPCKSCVVRQHCGAWNQTYADGFDGADLCAVKAQDIATEDSNNFNEYNYYFSQNNANNRNGYFG